MASTCISTCVNDTRVPVRATYVNLYKWPESDFEFVRSMSANVRKDAHANKNMYGHPRVVDSFSCRQLYLRSYTFSREEDYGDEKTIKCLGKGKDKTTSCKGGSERRKSGGGGRKKCEGRLRRGKAAACSAWDFIFRRLLSCTTEIDVVN